MKPSLFKTLTIAVFSLSLIAAAPAFAGKRNHGNHHNNHGYNSHNNHHSHNKHYRGHRRHHSNHKAGHIIGGIIGGVILSNVFNDLSNHRRSQTYSTTYSNYPPVRYANNVVINSTPYTTYRVLNGNECYLVNVNKFGNEVLTQVPNMNCGY